MMDNDDKLIARFFEENRQDILDKGFSCKVMRSLTPSYKRVNRIWTIVITIAAMALFLLVDGIDSLRTVLTNMFGDAIGFAASIHFSGVSPLIIVVAVLTVAIVSFYNKIICE